MIYSILEARIEFKDGKLNRITVLVDCTGDYLKPLTDVRAIFVTTKQSAGYMQLRPWHIISNHLLQEVAAAGMQTVDRDEIFPNWKNKFSKQTTDKHDTR